MSELNGGAEWFEFSTGDPDEAGRFFRHTYGEQRVRFTGRSPQPLVEHAVVHGPGFTVGRLRTRGDAIHAVERMHEDCLVVATLVGGRLDVAGNRYPDVRLAAGDVVLAPPAGALHATSRDLDATVVTVDRDRFIAYAAASTGIDPEDVRFDGITAISPALARYWNAAVAHARDGVLGQSWAVARPTLTQQAFDSLAAALLTTFPNTALTNATDPGRTTVASAGSDTGDTAPERDDASEATLREVVDYLRPRAEERVGARDVADVADVLVREVLDGLRQRHGDLASRLLWNARLRGIHRSLLDANPTSEHAVATAIAHWGLTDIPRTRLAYNDAFDETPEATLLH